MKIFDSKIGVLVMVVVLLSAAYSFYYHDRPRVDAKAYDTIAENLAGGYGYVEHKENAQHPEQDDAIARVGPGYQFFLAGVYRLFGHHIWIVWVLQALLRGASVLLVYYIAKVLMSDNGYRNFGSPTSELFHRLGIGNIRKEGIPLASAFLFGFAPDLVVVNGLLLTETLFLFLFLYATYETLRFFSRIDENPSHMSAWHTFGIGFLWTLTILTRPVALLPFFLVIGILFWKRRKKEAVTMLASPLFLIGAWSLFVSMRYDAFILTTTAGELDLWVGNNLQATGGFVKTPEIQAVRNMLHSVEFGAVARQKYWEFITTEPLSFLELQFRKTSLYFSLIRPTGFWIHLAAHPWDRLFTLLSSGMWTLGLLIFGISGSAVFVRKRRDIVSNVFVAFAAVQPLAVIPIIVETRYRYALFPFLAIFAAYFFMTRPIRWRVLVSVTSILVLFTAYDIWYNWADISNKIIMAFPFL